jgi:arginyl-tRNA synthetase
MSKTGFKVTKEYYVNDLGNQIENLFQTIKIHIENKVNNTNKALKEGMYKGDYLKEIAFKLIKENIDLSNKIQVKERIVEKILDLIKKDLMKLGIVFDSFISEKAIHKQGILNQVLDILNKKNLIYEGTLEAPKGKKDINWKPEDQLIFKSSNFGDSVDRAIKKNNGEWTYFASDIAYHHNKVERGFEEIINIWGADHAGYIKRVEASIKALANKQIKFDVKLCQIVNLLENNKSVKMSKRAGNFISINDILKKIDKDVVRFFMLIRKNDAHLDFDMKKCLDESKENPIFYIQYAIARINSLNKFFKEKQLKLLDFNQKLFDRFDENEITLLKTLSLWPKVVESSVIYKEPHRIVYFLIDLAGAFHNYWSKGNLDSKMRVINETDIELTVARLTLLNCISKVIKLGLDTLAIKPVEKM